MREALLSSGLFVARTVERERVRQEDRNLKQVDGWSPEDFAREQIRGLVRQVFFSNAERPVRQVVFSAAGPETEVQNLCWQVSEALALETMGSIALVGDYPHAVQDAEGYATEMTATEMANPLAEESSSGLRRAAIRLRANLWLVPPAGNRGDQATTAVLHSYLGALRTQFEYSIVVGPSAAETNARAMAQAADGIVLVLSAHHTRRITARKIKENLEAARARLLGTVLGDRVFPIPERIYRRL
jgi:hypothetical protein